MAYEKYIKKDGKLYGPYIYHSRRIDGKVVSEYRSKKKIDYEKFLWIIPIFLLIIFGAYLIGNKNNKLTGYSILNLNANYKEGQALDGKIKLSLQQGELIPASSAVTFENAGKKYEYPLKDLISDPVTEGNFFLKERAISGSGQGFGISGTRDIHPEVYFILLIYSPQAKTGNVVTESEKEVQGNISAGDIFTYTLQEGERAELKPTSVRTSSGQLSESSVSLITKGNLVSVSTNYSEKEEGFGSNYSGEKIKDFTINLNKLNLSLEKGNLKVGVFYLGEEIISLETIINNGTISNGSQIITPTTIQLPEIIPNDFNKSESINTIPVINNTIELTSEEKTALEKEFGNISLGVKEEKTNNGFIIVRYELRQDTWVNFSYSSDLNNNTLNLLIQQDKIKWLKDLAKKYSV